MSNTYFRMGKEVVHEPNLGFDGYTNKFDLSLTAFIGSEKSGNIQLTIRTDSTIGYQSGTAYITLNDDEIDQLIFGLLERKLKLISATGDEQSSICPEEIED